MSFIPCCETYTRRAKMKTYCPACDTSHMTMSSVHCRCDLHTCPMSAWCGYSSSLRAHCQQTCCCKVPCCAYSYKTRPQHWQLLWCSLAAATAVTCSMVCLGGRSMLMCLCTMSGTCLPPRSMSRCQVSMPAHYLHDPFPFHCCCHTTVHCMLLSHISKKCLVSQHNL